MTYYAWYYNAGHFKMYWGKAYEMSCFQFARDLSRLINENLVESDISAAETQYEFEKVKQKFREVIEIE